MQLVDLPLYATLVVGIIGFALMCGSFVLVSKRGGWQQAMQNDTNGRKSLPRRLMIVGALLGCLFGVGICVLFLTPSGIPWLRAPSQWEISVENKGTSQCSVYVTMDYSGNGAQGTSEAKVQAVAAGEKLSLIVGDAARTIRSIKVERGEDEQELKPNAELRPGRRYEIVVTAEGKTEASFADGK